MTLGDKLKLLRNKIGITQECLAERLNVSRSAIAKWESNNGIPDVNNLQLISQIFDISIDELLDNKIGIGTSNVTDPKEQYEYAGCCCDIDLVGWNDGVYGVIILREDEDFLFYQKEEKDRTVYGLLGKKYIKSIEQHSPKDILKDCNNINRDYFCNKHVFIEVASKEGILKGFFDFRNDDYLDVVIRSFEGSKVLLKLGREIEVGSITKIEELGV